MSNELGTTNIHAWAPESTKGTDPIADENTAIYHFGKFTKVYDYPVDNADYEGVYTNSLDPSEIINKAQPIAGSAVFTPVNGIWDYYTLQGAGGSGVSHNAGEFTLTPVTDFSIDTPSLTARSHWGNSNEDVREHWLGLQVNSLIGGINFQLPNAVLDEAISLVGLNRSDPYTPAARHTPSYPSSQSNIYKLDSNTVFTVDGVSYLNKGLMQFTYRIDNNFMPFDVDGQLYAEDNLRGNRVISFAFDIMRVQSTDTLWAAIKASKSGTKFDIQFDLYNSANTYRKKTFNNCVANATPNRALSDFKTKPVYRVSGIASSISPVNKDGLATSFYGV